MGLSIDNVLSAHGVGAGPGPFFGDGSDGTFNPLGTSTIANVVLIPDGKTYLLTNGNGWPGSSTTTTPNFFPLRLQISAVNGNPVPNVGSPGEVYNASIPNGTSSATSTYGYTAGVKFTTDNAITLESFSIYTSAVIPNGSVMYLWDNTGAVLASQNVQPKNQGAANQWIEMTTNINLAAGTYWIGWYQSATLGQGTSFNLTSTTSNKSFVITGLQKITFTSTQDGGPVVKQFTSVNIPANVLVGVSNRCQGLIMLVQGDVTIDGAISMDGMAPVIDPIANPALAVIQKVQQLVYPLGNNKYVSIVNGGAGGAGGSGGGVKLMSTNVYGEPGGVGGTGSSGSWFGGGRGGGGGGGSSIVYRYDYFAQGGKGGDGGAIQNQIGGTTSTILATGPLLYTGNPGQYGGGGSGSISNSGHPTSNSALNGCNGGAGGLSACGSGGGGGYASTGSVQSPPDSTNGQAGVGQAGGLILIIARGNVTINNTAVLSANATGQGGSGGDGFHIQGSSMTVAAAGGGGGGGAGGGVISIFHQGIFTNSGTLAVAGSLGGLGGNGSDIATNYSGTWSCGSHGGTGTQGQNGNVQIVQL